MEEFVHEKIKDKPLNKKKIIIRLGLCALGGIIFALTACITFAIFGPKSNNDSSQKENTYSIVGEQGEISVKIEDDTDDMQPVNKDGDTYQYSITLEDYQKIQSQLYAIANTVNKSIVAITSVSSDTDWFNNSYETELQGAGVVISDAGNELLILTEKKAVQEANRISVTFINEDSAEAIVKKYDGNTGVAILSVDKSNIDSSTLELIKVANIGNSNSVTKGSITIALGSPLGTCYSILTGNITSNDNVVSTLDCNYPIFTTDILASEEGSGILINVKGEIIGLIKQDYGVSSSGNTLTAIGISEIKPVIDLLMVDKQIPYLGVYGTTVTDSIAKKYSLPKGVYVKEVKMDSPAMVAGVQSGDVITEIAGTEVSSVTAYYSQLLTLNVEQQYLIKLQRKSNSGYKEITIQVEPEVLQ